MPSLRPLAATDEDLALRAPADFALLVPAAQRLAVGTDGTLAAADRWMLASATVDFAAQGVGPGHVLLCPTGADGPMTLFVVAETVGAAVRLRRLGHGPGVGQPPAPAGGRTGVEFLVGTLAPQIAIAGRELDRLLGGPGVAADSGRRELVVVTVLARQYRALSHATADPGDPFAARAREFQAERDARLGRLLTHPDASGRPRRLTRIER